MVGFAEEEGQRYKATFLGSGALIGHFNPAWLDQQDADGVTATALGLAGAPARGIGYWLELLVLAALMAPVAEQRGLAFHVGIADGAPARKSSASR